MNEIVIKDWKLLSNPSQLEGEWITSEELGKHLGYVDARVSINNIYNRHSEDFINNKDTTVIKLMTVGKEREIRIFSQRGCLKIIRYSGTEVANKIMDEVFDIYLEISKVKGVSKYDKHPMMLQLKESSERLYVLTENFCQLEDEQKRQAAILQQQQDKIKIIEAKTDAIRNETGYMTALAYTKLKGMDYSLEQLCYGKVNTYSEEILNRVFDVN